MRVTAAVLLFTFGFVGCSQSSSDDSPPVTRERVSVKLDIPRSKPSDPEFTRSRYEMLMAIAESRVELRLSIITLLLEEQLLQAVLSEREALSDRIIAGKMWPHEEIDFELRKLQNREAKLREQQTDLSQSVEVARLELQRALRESR